MKKQIIITFLLLPFFLVSTELKPWTDVDLRPEFRSGLLYQTFNKVETDKGKKSYRSNDFFLTESLALSLDQFTAEVEICAAATRKQHFNVDHLKLTGRYRLLNDIVDDPVSIFTGLSLVQAGKPALYDPASFHHGLVTLETHLAIGKEISKEQFWLKRYYAIFSLGFSSGYPWLNTEFSFEKNCFDFHQFKLFTTALMGFGDQKLNLNCFRGYGSIQHRSVDLGFRYSYLLHAISATLSLEYSHRIYAKNFPSNTNRFFLSLFYPFGTGF